ncbi:MAG: L-threonylcarbamoyladenylate synthase [Rhodospirillales bacterium]
MRDSKIIAASRQSISSAARLIGDGKLVAFPTETVYGLGADATNDKAVAEIFAAKERPSFNPLIVHFADSSSAEKAARFNARARELAAAFWPGALSMVLERLEGCAISLLVSAGLDTVALRVPNHPVALALLAEAPCPIAAPSANRSGAVSPTTAVHVEEALGSAVAAIVDGGPCRVGIESTVVDLSGESPLLLRPGGITEEEIEAVIGPLAKNIESKGGVKSPGMLERHYAPATPLRINAAQAREGEARLSFGPDAPHDALNLSPTGDLKEAAANLFAMIRQLDDPKYNAIAVMEIPNRGLGRAINDRLTRAAAKCDNGEM